MFRIEHIDHLKRYNRILDCPSGASSFVAEANNRYGINTIGCDPLFDRHSRILQKQGEEDIEYVVNRVSLAPELYNWDFYSYRRVKGLQKTGVRTVHIRLQP